MMKNLKFMGVFGGLVLAIVFVVAPSFVNAANDFGSTTLRVGSKGSNVRALQELLATDRDMYPSGSVDGSFGPNTKNAVVQFQLAYGLSADGIFGRNSMTTANSLVDAGRGVDVSAPIINNLVVNTSGRNVTLSFSSNESVKTALFYDTNAINWSNWDDAVMSFITPNISGMTSVDNSYSTNKQFNLSNLSQNTTYNYTITATDQSGNISVIWPTTFRTAQ
jgi:peptidoglycan hydrolase-like protein with peptidoglycan-binding domain